MKTTAFTEFHLKAGARMVPFAGYNMPVEYSGITDEHLPSEKELAFLMFLIWVNSG
jgi:glycine cleavage system aminomethyltransferase T